MVDYIPELDYAARDYKPFLKSPGNMCRRCKEYYKRLEAANLVPRADVVPCRGAITEHIKALRPEDFDSEEEYYEAIAVLDPVFWAYKEFGWQARWYQSELLTCLPGSQLVAMADGTFKPIKDIQVGDRICAVDNTSTVSAVVEAFFYRGVRKVYRVRLDTGDQLLCTSDHKILTLSGHSLKYTSIDEGLGPDDSVIVLGTMGRFGKYNDTSFGALCGYLAASSSFTGKQIIFSTRWYPVVDAAHKLAKRHFPDVSGVTVKTDIRGPFWEFTIGGNTHNVFSGSDDYFLRKAFSFNHAALRSFLSALWAAGGSVSPEVEFTSNSVVFLRLLRLLLRKFGIFAEVDGQTLRVLRGHPTRRFLETIDPIKSIEYTEALREARKAASQETIPELTVGHVVSIEPVGLMSVYDISVRNYHNFIAEGIVVHNCTAQFKVLRMGRRVGKSESLAIYTLHKAYTNADFPILVVTPYEAQLNRFFEIMEGFIGKSANVKSAIARLTKNPHRLEFHNGSRVLGFTGGAKSGAKSDKIRGQDARLIVLDEAAWLEAREINPIMAILASHSDCELVASSTPTDSHDTFWQYWHDKRLGFKEFHVISQESPVWTEQTERFFRASYTKGEYYREIYAEPGYSEGTVFRSEDIDRALVDYDLSECTFDVNGRYCIGIDWNKTAGMHLVVMEYKDGVFKLVQKEILVAEEFKQLEAVRKVLEIWEKWPTAFVYPDEGYGATQIELLKKSALSSEHRLWRDKVKPVNMASTVEVRDPITGLLEKKPVKPFMVNLAALYLENGWLVLPASEDLIIHEEENDPNRWGLARQMRNFKIVRYTASGHPVYTDEHEHTLTAFMLALYGLVAEYSDMIKWSGVSRVAIVRTKDKPAQPEAEAIEKVKERKLERKLDLSVGGTLRGFHRAMRFRRGIPGKELWRRRNI